MVWYCWWSSSRSLMLSSSFCWRSLGLLSSTATGLLVYLSCFFSDLISSFKVMVTSIYSFSISSICSYNFYISPQSFYSDFSWCSFPSFLASLNSKLYFDNCSFSTLNFCFLSLDFVSSSAIFSFFYFRSISAVFKALFAVNSEDFFCISISRIFLFRESVFASNSAILIWEVDSSLFASRISEMREFNRLTSDCRFFIY